ncbi:hypothetical protein [Helicobacter sp. T3_23-1056]
MDFSFFFLQNLSAKLKYDKNKKSQYDNKHSVSLLATTLPLSLRALQRNAWQSIRLSYDKHSVIASER